MGFAKLARMSWPQLERRIRTAARAGNLVFVTAHAKVRMEQRKITQPMLLECLSFGTIARAPEPNEAFGSLECQMCRYCSGHNLCAIVALTDEDPDAVVVTMMIKE